MLHQHLTRLIAVETDKLVEICNAYGKQISTLITINDHRHLQNDKRSSNQYFLSIAKFIVGVLVFISTVRLLFWTNFETVVRVCGPYVPPSVSAFYSDVARSDAGSNWLKNQAIVLHTFDDLLSAGESAVGLQPQWTVMLLAFVYACCWVMCR